MRFQSIDARQLFSGAEEGFGPAISRAIQPRCNSSSVNDIKLFGVDGHLDQGVSADGFLRPGHGLIMAKIAQESQTKRLDRCCLMVHNKTIKRSKQGLSKMTTTHTITTEQMLAARVWLRFPSLMGRELNWIATPRSSFITHAAWISTGVVDGKLTGTVVIAMSSGIYAYHGVPISTYGAFHRSARKGKAYHRLFKGHFTSSVVFRVPRARTTTTQVRTTAAERRALNNARLLGLAA